MSNSFIGKGWSFPPKFEKERNSLSLVSELQSVKQSLSILMSTSPGERQLNLNYGCDLRSLSFATIDSLTLNTMTDMIKNSILQFEPRITLEDVVIDTSRSGEGLVEITLLFFVRKINIRTNMVYPFYFNEGTNIALDY